MSIADLDAHCYLSLIAEAEAI